MGTYQETSSHATRQGTLSQLAESLWTDPDLKSGISARELISTQKKKKKKAQAGNELSNILPKYSHTRKKPPEVVLATTGITMVDFSLGEVVGARYFGFGYGWVKAHIFCKICIILV